MRGAEISGSRTINIPGRKLRLREIPKKDSLKKKEGGANTQFWLKRGKVVKEVEEN